MVLFSLIFLSSSFVDWISGIIDVVSVFVLNVGIFGTNRGLRGGHESVCHPRSRHDE